MKYLNNLDFNDKKTIIEYIKDYMTLDSTLYNFNDLLPYNYTIQQKFLTQFEDNITENYTIKLYNLLLFIYTNDTTRIKKSKISSFLDNTQHITKYDKYCKYIKKTK